MPDLPLVSIIAVCYNHADYVTQTLDSIVNQSYPNIQLIIVDDYSKDNSVDQIRSWININSVECKLITHSKNLGLCKTLNEALEFCKGYFTKIIACDDILDKEKIRKQVEVFENSPTNVQLVCSNFCHIDENNLEISKYNFPTEYKFPEDPFIGVLNGYQGFYQIVHSPTVLIKSSVYQKVGKYDESLIQEDLDMWLRITENYEARYLPDVLVKYRILSSSLSKDPSKKLRVAIDRFRVILKYNSYEEEKTARGDAIRLAKYNSIRNILLLTINHGNKEEIKKYFKLLSSLKEKYKSLEFDFTDDEKYFLILIYKKDHKLAYRLSKELKINLHHPFYSTLIHFQIKFFPALQLLLNMKNRVLGIRQT